MYDFFLIIHESCIPFEEESFSRKDLNLKIMDYGEFRFVGFLYRVVEETRRKDYFVYFLKVK